MLSNIIVLGFAIANGWVAYTNPNASWMNWAVMWLCLFVLFVSMYPTIRAFVLEIVK